LLASHEVPYEVVPGITSAIAVPAYNGIPVTHRDFTSSLHVIAGHKRAGTEYDIDFEALVRTKGTLVFLMGVRALPDIMAGLMVAGMAAETPAAVLQEGTTAGQKRVVATVGTLAEAAAKAQIAAPAIIVVGDVCTLADQFSWHEKLPLHGCKVVVTRPAELASTMSKRLRVLGAEVLDIPATEIVPIRDNEALNHAFYHLASYDWLVFTSPSGVRVFFDAMIEAGIDHRLISGKIAALGKGTLAELRKRGFLADLVPETATGEALGAALASVVETGASILIPRARVGNKALVAALSACDVDDVPTYDTVALDDGLVNLVDQFGEKRIFCVALTSSSGALAFAEANPGLDFSKVQAACIGEKTRATAEKLGMRTWMAAEATMDSLCALIMERYDEAKQNGGI